MSANPTACLIIIGNEILSGRTHDKNLPHIATVLNEAGVRLREVRVIPDIEETIIATVNEMRAAFTYVFTTGGIGPTHDDITTASVGKAFGAKVSRHPEAERLLRAHYRPEDVNESRMKMADIPEGATLILNRVSAAPGFVLGNVYVLAGVPRIMQAMMEEILPSLKGGKPVRTHSFEIQRPEGDLAEALTHVQAQFADVEIGIYPLIKHGKLASSIVCRCDDENMLKRCTDAVRTMCAALGAPVSEEV